MDAILFYLFAALAVVSAVVVIAQKNPITSAFALIVTLAVDILYTFVDPRIRY